MLVFVIIGCETGFWVLVGAGLAARYLVRLRRVGTVLLALVPLLDVVLLVATVADLVGRHAVADAAHGLAAVYLGFTVVFGPSMVRWADRRFAHRFGHRAAPGHGRREPTPARPPKSGPARARYEWREWGKAVLASAIAAVLLVGMAVLVGPRGDALLTWLPRLGVLLAIWLIWPVTSTFGALRGERS